MLTTRLTNYGTSAALVTILVLEVRLMMTLIRWCRQLGHDKTARTDSAPTLARTRAIQGVVAVTMVLAPTAVARGTGAQSVG